jgi:hypothetical protein
LTPGHIDNLREQPPVIDAKAIIDNPRGGPSCQLPLRQIEMSAFDPKQTYHWWRDGYDGLLAFWQ